MAGQPKHPLVEVFGFPVEDMGAEAVRHRKLKLCPFNNKEPNCTKDRATAPLGTCTVRDGQSVAVTCPIRFREGWKIAEHAADFFFNGGKWTSLTEVRLNEANGKSAGNIDVVLVSYDEHGTLLDFGALEVQAVYISGNIRRPFEHYLQDPPTRKDMNWEDENGYPRPDYLSSSRKRLAPQLLFKGGILHAWGKKSAVALSKGFFATLPELEQVSKADGDVAWLVYDVVWEQAMGKYVLTLLDTVYTKFKPAMAKLTTATPGKVADFVALLQRKLDERLEELNAPDTNPIKLDL